MNVSQEEFSSLVADRSRTQQVPETKRKVNSSADTSDSSNSCHFADHSTRTCESELQKSANSSLSASAPSSNPTLTRDESANSSLQHSPSSQSNVSLVNNCSSQQRQTCRKTAGATNWYSLPVIQVAVLGFNCWLIVCTIFILHQVNGATGNVSSRRNSHPNVFSNQFALNIPAGDAKADEIARKYGYRNLGQVSCQHIFDFLFCCHFLCRSPTSWPL